MDPKQEGTVCVCVCVCVSHCGKLDSPLPDTTEPTPLIATTANVRANSAGLRLDPWTSVYR